MSLIVIVICIGAIWAIRGEFPWVEALILMAAALLAVSAAERLLNHRLGKAPQADPDLGTDPDSNSATSETLETELQLVYQQALHPRAVLESPAFQQAEDYFLQKRTPIEELRRRVYDDSECVNMAAVAALLSHEDEADTQRILDCIGNYSPWNRAIALFLLDRVHPAPEPQVHRVLAQLDATWFDAWNLRSLREWVQYRHAAGERAPTDEAWVKWCASLSPERLDFFQRLVDALGPFVAKEWEPALRTIPTPEQSTESSGPRLELPKASIDGIGRRWNQGNVDEFEQHSLPEETAAMVDRIVANFTAEKPRATVVVGRPRTGKSTVIQSVLRRLIAKGWVGLEISADELNAGMSFVGQLEGQVMALAQEVEPGKHCLWVLPDMTSMLWSGAVSGDQGRTIARAMRADLERGRVMVLAECTRAEWEHARALHPWFAECFEVVEVPIPDAGATIDLVQRWIADRDGHPDFSADLVRETWELARQFLQEEQRPGNLFDCVRQVIEDPEHDAERPFTRSDVLQTLARRTGLPLVLLDDRETLDLPAVESEFQSRVQGQPEATRCIVDRLAMMKSGVTDPSRPLGVFLFAGPTGTGKTELAKTLAAWLFGSEGRLVRLDMSELREHGALEKILGSRDREDRPGLSLLEQVRQQPFSVVLLDEFEKADASIWNLFLQVFDDGRLADRRGRIADFRHTIILMTSNLGSRIRKGPGLGFRDGDLEFRAEDVVQAIEGAFSPEFLNRIDRTIVFRPLSRQTMRSILLQQIERVLRRRGLRDRPWAVEWDDGALEFLLDRGFTRELGARPLQRALDRHLLTPLARTITTNQAPDGDQFLFVRRRGESLEIEFVDPDAPHEEWKKQDGTEPRDLSAIAMDASGSASEMATLNARLSQLEDTVGAEPWQRQRQQELDAMSSPGFWETSDRFALLDRFERRERIERATGNARSFFTRLVGDGRETVAARPVQDLAIRVHVLEAAVRDLEADRPGEVGLVLETGHGEAGSPPFLRSLADMYSNWARKRGARLRVLTPRESSPGRQTWSAVVDSFGACELLAPEAGLHVLELPLEGKSRTQRETLNVRVIPLDASRRQDWSAPAALAELVEGEAPSGSPRIVRRYRHAPSPLVRDTVRGFRTGRIDRVLGGDFDLVADEGTDAGQAEADS